MGTCKEKKEKENSNDPSIASFGAVNSSPRQSRGLPDRVHRARRGAEGGLHRTSHLWMGTVSEKIENLILQVLS